MPALEAEPSGASTALSSRKGERTLARTRLNPRVKRLLSSRKLYYYKEENQN
jgi:hypothetical protein